MNIIINAASIFKGGAEQVAHSFINECVRFPEHNYYVLLRDNIESQLNIHEFPENFTFYNIKQRPGKSVFQIYKSLKYFNRLADKIKPDVVISTGGHGFWKPVIPVVGGFNIPHFVYPESPYFSKISLKKRLYWKLKKTVDLLFYRRLNAIVVQTDDVKNRLGNLIKQKPIYTISNTVNATFYNPRTSALKLPERAENEFRLLTVSADYPHKNLEVIKEVIKELQKRGYAQVKFILTLPDDSFKKFNDRTIKDHLINVGPVSIHECPALYRECDAMFLPTLLECFSASYAEAMMMGKPILTSDLGFANTVCKKSALYFNPVDPVNITDNIERLINDSELYKSLIVEGKKELSQLSTPSERAERFIRIAEGLVKSKT